MARPLKLVQPDEPKDNVTVGLRMSPELKNRLVEAAKKADRNLSQETIRRLRLSFDCDCEHTP